MAHAYRYFAPHGCWTADKLRYIERGDVLPSLEGVPVGYHHRFAVVPIEEAAPVAETPEENRLRELTEDSPEVSDD